MLHFMLPKGPIGIKAPAHMQDAAGSAANTASEYAAAGKDAAYDAAGAPLSLSWRCCGYEDGGAAAVTEGGYELPSGERRMCVCGLRVRFSDHAWIRGSAALVIPVIPFAEACCT